MNGNLSSHFGKKHDQSQSEVHFLPVCRHKILCALDVLA